MKRVLVLSTTSEDGKMLLWCLREAGHRAYTIGNRSTNLALRYSPLSEKFFDVPVRYSYEQRSPEIVQLIAAAVEQANIDIIIPSGFESVKFISEYQDQLRRMVRVTAVPSLEMIGLLGNKHSFALFCGRNDIPHPPTMLLERAEDVLGDGLPMTFPLMTKPLALSSGEGVCKFEDKQELYQYLSTPRQDGVNAMPLLLQEFIPGEDIDFSGFCADGRLASWSIQRSVGFDSNARWLQFERSDDVLRIGRRIVEVTRYNGPIHIDLRVDARTGSVKTIEVNPRYWTSVVASICDGVNFGDVAVQQAFESDYSKPPLYSTHIWGTPRRLPELLYEYGSKLFYDWVTRHTLFELKYRFLDKTFSWASTVRSMFSRV